MNPDMQPYQKLVIQELVLPVSIGVYPQEKEAPQRLSISVDIYITDRLLGQDDDVANVVDYDFVRRAIHELVTEKHFELQESLCMALMGCCFAHPEVLAVKVATAKLDIYPDCEAVGVEVFRRRQDWLK